MKIGKTLYCPNRTSWRRWLTHHHSSDSEIWLIYYKKGSSKPRIPYNDAVEEALCFGWIDSIVKSIDAERYAQRFTPRKPKSMLSDMNKERIRRLIASNKMTPAGLSAIAHHLTKKKTLSPRFIIPADIRAALQSEPAAWKNFRRFPLSYKRIRVGWIDASRNRPDFFRKRLQYFVRMCARNKQYGMVR